MNADITMMIAGLYRTGYTSWASDLWAVTRELGLGPHTNYISFR